MVVVVEDGQTETIVGYGHGMVSEHDEHIPAKSGTIANIWVEPDHRRRGLCKEMVSHLLRFFRSRDIESLVLNYIEGNAEARAVWSRLGFRTVMATSVATVSDVGSLLEQAKTSL